MLGGTEVTARYKLVKEDDGRYRWHSMVFIDEKELDLTEVRREVAAVGFERPAMRRIFLNVTFVEGGHRVTFAETGGVGSLRGAVARGREYMEHGARDPL